MNNTKNNTIMTLTIELPRQIEVSPTTGGKQMKATVHLEYPCADTLAKFLCFDLKRRAENMVRQDGARQDVYSCVVQGGKLQRMDKSSGVEAAVRTERFRVIDKLVESGMTREQALELVGCMEEDLPQ